MELASWCANLAQASADASAWVERNPDIVRNEKEGLLKELRRAGRLFRSCGRAAGRKMCAGVFGPSQAGKSYLISALARGAGNQLNAVFGDKQYDFVSEINPEGGKESTGLVTRFTLTPDKEAPAAYPVRLAMLSETDLVKIIANTYYADCEHKEATQSDIAASLEKLHKRVGVKQSHIDLDAMEDLREYLLNDFRAKPRVQELERTYWEDALALAPILDLEGRIQLYALIWDEVEEFTNLLRQMLKALESLGYPEICYCPIDALVPRSQSIIDVATLADLDKPQTEARLEVCSASGEKATLPLALVTALTAELTIVMADKPADYFEHTDLLDFPGYRSRYKLDDLRRELKKEGMLKELFLRGKVAYLFQRYCAQRELNSMLLCIGPSNQEVQDLPGVINSWVCTTHGETPEERAGKKTSLFFILTKFDMEFEDKKGAPSLESRWDNRLHASLLDFFGKQHDWPTQWTPNRGFDNMYLLRNPNFRFEAIMEFDGDTETGIRPQRQEYVDKLKAAFLNSTLVAEHFPDPARAWQEAMRLNDGGISWIRQSLSPLCDPAIKEEQLLQNIDNCRKNILRRLDGFHQSDDREELRKQKLSLITSLFSSMGALEKQKHRLGQLMRNFTISDADIFDLHYSAMRKIRTAGDTSAQTQPEVASEEIDPDSIDLGALNPFSGEEPDPEKDTAATQIQDEASAYAAVIESKWVEGLHQLANDPAMQKFYMLKAQDFSALAAELAIGAERLGIRERLASDFRKAAAYANTSKGAIAKRQASIAAAALNHYIDWLGFNPHTQSDAQRTIQLPTGKPPVVFSPGAEIKGLPEISENRSQYTQKWFNDWLYALAGLILDNVNFDGNKLFNAAENAVLGAILKKLAKDAVPEQKLEN